MLTMLPLAYELIIPCDDDHLSPSCLAPNVVSEYRIFIDETLSGDWCAALLHHLCCVPTFIDRDAILAVDFDIHTDHPSPRQIVQPHI